MSQGGNLLAGYAQNPNQDPADRQYFPETDYTPSLSQSQLNLKRKEKKITIIFGVSIAILVALLLVIVGYSVFQHYKNRPVVPEEPTDIGGEDIDSCEHCINLADLKRQAAESIESAKSYIHGRISAVTSADLKEGEDQLAQIEKYAESVKGDANLKGQFEELLQKWRKLQEELNKVLETNQDVSKMRDDYDKKVQEINRLKDQVLEAIQSSLNADNTKRELQSQKYQLQQDIDSKKVNLRAQKEPLLQEIERLEGDVRRVLDNAGVRSVEELDQIISKLKGRIEHVDDEKKDCTTNIDKDSERISTLYRRLTEEMTKLGDIEVELIHSNWVQHVTETINKFKAIQEELRALKLSQLEDGKDNLYQAILALERKEITIAQLLKELYEGDSLTIEEERLLNDPNVIIDQTTLSSKRSVIKRTKSFQRYIETGKDELKVWGRQQFNTTFVTMKDIQDLDDIIEYFTNALKDYPKSPETLTSERDEQNNTVNSIRQQIESLEASIRRCQDLIRDSEATVAREQEKLRANEKDRETLRTLLSQLDKKRAELKELESKFSSEIEDLERRKRDVEKKLADLNDGESKERRLRDLTNRINEKIASPPSAEDMEKALGQYQTHANKAADAHKEFDDLLNRIKANI